MDFGPKYINCERKIQYSTLAKEAIKIKNKNETLAEEMRLLYVALTRSKEKLIITGIEKNAEKSFADKKELLNVDKEKNKISKSILRKAKSYLDWIEFVSLNNDMKDILEIKTYNKREIKTNMFKNKTTKSNKLNIENKQISEDTNKLLTWEYEYKKASQIEGKTSVSKLTKKNEKIELDKKPMFLNETEILNKAEIGTIMHLILQKLDLKKEYNLDEINKLIEKQVLNKVLTKTQSESIDKEKILNFTKSNLYKKIKNAKQAFKEKSFYTNIEIEGEKILVQGVIDLYFIDENNDIIILDYKTDNVKKTEEDIFTEKYKEQLIIYKKALEQALNKEVKEVYIYSTCLDKEICLQVM